MKKRKRRDPGSLDKLIDELTEAGSDDEQIWNFQRELQKQIWLPCEGFVTGEPVRGSTVVMPSIASGSVKTVLIHLISRSVDGVLALMAQSSTNSAFPTDARIRDLLVERIDKQHRCVGVVVGLIDST